MRYKTLPFETLQLVLDEENYKKVIKFCAGYSILFPKRKIMSKLIVDSYKKMRKAGMSKPSSVLRLAQEYGKSRQGIYEILRKNGL
ncbi:MULTISPECIES: hypothetical protein [unclassified Nitratiruptor]|uniref:hypothetical protein n=1 Tax=unclassified Nitratiruptor TaxID=2624044 RepID=UPI001914E879|nr:MULTISPECIES: hypothetical protein [unclassified Nitratiruptor]BCD59620.1 hypothetical protein NitYY0810_C0371 [Nitratiruptor sp. YY08-10]BCD63544.1 hypothetical protein NitYY0814_C0371 [Nitratiruptor sp. YY08-14]BCD83096.1 hypothetical protein NrS2_46 [Nitratiruptor phage NrS-2]BCD83162.1 hypothetical protein NrS3_46 [Nitratiruptor phage NrS-3]